MKLDANNNSNMTVTVFANERVFNYSIQLYKILKIHTTDITNGSNPNTTVMYSMPTTGTSKNSTAIKLEGTYSEQCTAVFTFTPPHTRVN